MRRLKGLLRPQTPIRGQALDARARFRNLLDPAGLDELAREIERLACETLGCEHATLVLDKKHPPEITRRDSAAAESLCMDLAGDRAQLVLEFQRCIPAQRSWTDSDCAWIDIADVRLREALRIADLTRDLETARSDETLQQALYTIANLAYSNIDITEMMARVHAVVGRLTYAENFYVAFYDDTRDVITFPYYSDTDDQTIDETPVELFGKDYPSSLTFAVAHTGRSMLGSSAGIRAQLGITEIDPRLGPDCVDWLGVPMLEGDRVRGAVVVQSYDESRRYSEDDRRLLTFVAQHVLSVVSRKKAREELELEVQRRTAELADTNQTLRNEVSERQRAQRMQAALFRIVELASESTRMDAFYVGVHNVVSGLLNARNFFISLLSEDGSELRFPYYVDQHDTAFPARRLGNGITDWVINHRRPLLATETEIRDLIEAGEMIVFGTLPKCWLGVPLLLDERALGVMVVQSYDAEDDYGVAEQEILQFASFQIATALERKRSQERLLEAHADLERRVGERTEELKLANEGLRQQIAVRKRAESRLKHEAFHDGLTGLPNRAALLMRLRQVLGRFQHDPSRLFAVLFLDLDRFKVVNDSVGHLLGDELLVEAGKRISRCVRSPDSVARLGGDEFTILLEDISCVDDACQIATRVLEALVDPIRLGDKEIYTSASIGIALAHERYQLPEELLRDADVAMYRAKAHGRQRFELFDEQLRREALDMLDLESDLRRALTRDEFEPFLQPIVRLADGAVLGYEALLRWRHAKRGILLPEDFLAVAEDSGNVEQIDWQLYEKVCRAIAGLDDPTAYVGINVSARHFRSPNLVTTLLELLKAYDVPTWRIRIEVTEGALLQDPEQAIATMLQLREAGVLTSLDDFGTGYSSLSYLHRFPLHALKIDQSFIAELNSDLSGSSAAVVRAIRALAESLGMEVIAEGIETSDQCDALIRLDCKIGQGFLFARPQPTDNLARVN
ncbi:EAL domain-containing protein [Dokdonella sp.]|uniref:bifunctional diguanylate cyclase/phosphodiesterase n=1 Tax=Dokdonella sp. TaxID=2291710 RepID=UPI003527445F